MYVYVNVSGRIIEGVPYDVEEIKSRFGHFLDGYKAKFLTQLNAEEKRDGYYVRILDEEPKKIKNHTLWLPYKDPDEAKELFRKEAEEKYKKIKTKLDALEIELERLS